MQSYKTALSFGLVYVPVTLHACIKSDDISFNTLYKKTGERIRYKKTCATCPSNLDNGDIVKGFQYEKDKYVVLSQNEIEKLKTQKDKAIQIEKFVKLTEIDPLFFDKSYFINPIGAENAFLLIKKALKKQNKVGIAKTVLGTKEQLVAVREIDGQLILSTLHFFDELQQSPVKEITDKVTAKELSLAELIVENMTSSFNIEQYKNEYRQKLLKAIDDKIAGKKIKGEVSHFRPNNIINLMEALQKSVGETEKKPARKKTKKAKISMISKRA